MMDINIASLLMKQNAPGRKELSKSAGGNNSFLSMLRKSSQAGIEKLKFTQHRTFQKIEKSNAKDFQIYIDSFRSGLLSKGKPFDEVYLERDDAYVLNDLLIQCGYSQNRVDKLITDLMENSQNGEIKLSQFFAQVKELGAPEKKDTGAITLEASIIPYLQSILRDFDLDPKEISKVLNRGRTQEGGLSLDNLIKDLEIVGNQAMQESRGIVDLHKSPQIIKNLESLGFQIPAGNKSGRVCIEDFIHALKQMAETVFETKNDTGDQALTRLNVDDIKGLKIQIAQTRNAKMVISEDKAAAPGKVFAQLENNKGVPPEVNDAINRILEKVVTPDKPDGSLTDIIKNSKIKFDDPGSKKIDIAGPLEEKKQSDPFGNSETVSTSKGDGKQISAIQTSGDMKSMMDFSGDPRANDPIELKTHQGNPTTKVFDIAQEIVNQREPETIQAYAQKTQNSGNSLPNYLVDQIGKQISRSIIRGDGVVRFQLKPSELGFVKLEMHMTDNHLNISAAAENSTVKELLLSNIQELREMLLGQGIKLDKIDVHISQDFNQTFSNLHEGTEKEQGSNQGENRKTPYLDHDDNQEEHFESRELSGHDSIVDLVA
jgi:flagellar hook-length control protein FliK